MSTKKLSLKIKFFLVSYIISTDQVLYFPNIKQLPSHLGAPMPGPCLECEGPPGCAWVPSLKMLCAHLRLYKSSQLEIRWNKHVKIYLVITSSCFFTYPTWNRRVLDFAYLCYAVKSHRIDQFRSNKKAHENKLSYLQNGSVYVLVTWHLTPTTRFWSHVTPHN